MIMHKALQFRSYSPGGERKILLYGRILLVPWIGLGVCLLTLVANLLLPERWFHPLITRIFTDYSSKLSLTPELLCPFYVSIIHQRIARHRSPYTHRCCHRKRADRLDHNTHGQRLTYFRRRKIAVTTWVSEGGTDGDPLFAIWYQNKLSLKVDHYCNDNLEVHCQ